MVLCHCLETQTSPLVALPMPRRHGATAQTARRPSAAAARCPQDSGGGPDVAVALHPNYGDRVVLLQQDNRVAVETFEEVGAGPRVRLCRVSKAGEGGASSRQAQTGGPCVLARA